MRYPQLKSSSVRTLFIIAMLFCGCKNQKSSAQPPDSAEFIIGSYLLNPIKKQVSIYTMVGGADWDGYMYTPYKKVNYNTTTLLLVGPFAWFKEDFPFPFDINTLRLIAAEKDEVLMRDKDYVYHFNNGSKEDGALRVSLAGFTAVNDYVYTRNGEGYYLTQENGLALKRIYNPAINISTLRHLAGEYFYDASGLYRMGGHSVIINKRAEFYDGSRLIQKAPDSAVRVKATPQYFIYGKTVYGNTPADYIEKLAINPATMIEVNDDDTELHFLTDGRNLYEGSNYYTASGRNTSGRINAFLGSGVTIQTMLPPNLRFFHTPKDTLEVNVVSREERGSYTVPDDNLIAKVNGKWYLLFADKNPLQLRRLAIFNDETGKTEEFNPEKFRAIYNNELFSYGNTLYYAGNAVYNRGYNINALHRLAGSGYVTDGKVLLYISNLGGYSIKQANGRDYVDFLERHLPNGYTSGLKTVNKDLLVDGDRILSKDKEASVKQLGLRIIALTLPPQGSIN